MSRKSGTSAAGSSGRFPTTPWSLILAAAQSDAPDSKAALASLCRSYWYPLYAFVRKNGHDQEDAQDLVQGFFARFLEKNYLKGRSPAQGRFRSYLLSALKHFVANEYDKSQSLKRGAGRPLLSLDVLQEGEWSFQHEPVTPTSPDTIYDQRWALLLLHGALSRLKAELEEAGKDRHYRVLEGFLPGGRQPLTYREAAASLGLSISATKVAIHRIRRRYREFLRQQVAQTVSDASEIDSEIRYLMDVLGR